MSEREEIIKLIRDEFDPKPNLGLGAYPAFDSEWDDGAGRIADAILADKTIAVRTALVTLASALKVFAPDLATEIAKRWETTMETQNASLERFLVALQDAADTSSVSRPRLGGES